MWEKDRRNLFFISKYSKHSNAQIWQTLTSSGTPQRVIEYKTKMIIAQTSEVYMVGIIRLMKPVKGLPKEN